MTTSIHLNQPTTNIACNLQTLLWNTSNQINCRSIYHKNDNSIIKRNHKQKQVEDIQRRTRKNRTKSIRFNWSNNELLCPRSNPLWTDVTIQSFSLRYNSCSIVTVFVIILEQ